jgi:hypothetical protein
MFQYMGTLDTKIHIITCESQIHISRCSGQCRKQSNMNFQVYWLCFAAQLLCRNVHQVLHIPVHIVASRVGLHLQSRSFPTEGVKGNPTLIEKGEKRVQNHGLKNWSNQRNRWKPIGFHKKWSGLLKTNWLSFKKIKILIFFKNSKNQKNWAINQKNQAKIRKTDRFIVFIQYLNFE